jgi:S-adenosylmethionine decarboxylase
MLIQRVVNIFQPRRLTLTLFISSDGGDVDSDVDDNPAEAAQRALKFALNAVPVVGVGTTNLYYKRTDKINYELGGYDLAFASFELQ